VFARLLRPGSVVIDVGANIGYYTLLAASRVGPQGHVHSVECAQETLGILKDNVRRNHLQNVTIHPVAAGKERGELQLNVSAIGLSFFALHEKWPKVAGSGNKVTVPVMPLDDLLSSSVHVVKIDAEGADLEVLQGMKRILSENPSISLIVEWAPTLLAEAGKDPLGLPTWLGEAGFTRITVLDEMTNKPMSLPQAINSMRAGKLPSKWVGDLFARREQKAV
jgi:FkbM family methyltransferase